MTFVLSILFDCNVMKERLRHLDLFSGIGGFTLALNPIVDTVGFCEKDPDCVAVLLKRMRDKLSVVPVFPDVTKLRGNKLDDVELITAGFPCQDISSANATGKGIGGKRSGLVHHVIRLIDEMPSVRVVFLENVERIQTRGLSALLKHFQRDFWVTYAFFTGYDVGAPHRRRRWFCLLVRKQWGKPLPLLPKSNHVPGWKGKAPPRLIAKKQSPADAYNAQFMKRYAMLGNAIIPRCAAFAWDTLAASYNDFITGSDKKVISRDKCRTLIEMRTPSRCIPRTPPPIINQPYCASPLKLLHAKNSAKIVSETCSWKTLTSKKDFNRQYHTYGTRGKNNLFTQIWYDKQTQVTFNKMKVPPFRLHEYYDVNPTFIEWFMGYPLNWTRT